LKPIRTISQTLVDQGYGMLRFDFTGLGQSEGNFSDTNFTSNCEDLRKAAGFLRDNYEAPKILIGHSFGGTAALKVVDELPELMIFHSPQDRVVGIQNASHIYTKARHPKSFVSLDNADHLLLKNPKDAEYIARVLAAWAARYI